MASAVEVARSSGPERILTLEDYLELPLDTTSGVEHEIIRGTLIEMPRPSVFHQLLSIRLVTALYRYLTRLGWQDVQLVLDADLLMDSLNSYVSPDLMIFGPEAVPALLDVGERRRRIHVVVARPLVAIEILSPSSRGQDLGEKRRDYEAVGIPHYWAFDGDSRTMHEFSLDSDTGSYRHAMHRGRRVRPSAFADRRPALSIDLERLWPGDPTHT